MFYNWVFDVLKMFYNCDSSIILKLTTLNFHSYIDFIDQLFIFHILC